MRFPPIPAMLVACLCLPVADGRADDKPASETLGKLSEWLGEGAEGRQEMSAQEFFKAPMERWEVSKAQGLLWEDHVAMIRATRKDEVEGRRVKVGDFEMPYLMETFGEKPAKGRSLYISMHGGGGAPVEVNDAQWKNQIRLYQPEEGIYLAPRAPANAWNMWHQAQVDGLFDRLIEDLIVFEDVDPDRVYLMGYSAGGDGVYQLAPRMADRFAAAAMMAGHPNETSPLGLRNLPFTLHVGGEDGAYNRNAIVPQWDEQLNGLRAADPDGYVHEAQVHDGLSHWMNLEDKVAVPWMAKFERKRLPDRVVWKQDDVTHRRFYWLSMPEDAVKARQLLVVRREGQVFTIEKAEDVTALTILLNDEMVDMDQPVVVKMGDEVLYDGKVKRQLRTILGTLAGRGDPGLVFSGGVTVKLEGGE